MDGITTTSIPSSGNGKDIIFCCGGMGPQQSFIRVGRMDELSEINSLEERLDVEPDILVVQFTMQSVVILGDNLVLVRGTVLLDLLHHCQRQRVE